MADDEANDDVEDCEHFLHDIYAQIAQIYHQLMISWHGVDFSGSKNVPL